MKKVGTLILAGLLLAALHSTAFAHFGMLIPDKSVISQEDKTATLTLSFSHPFEGVGMDLVKPKAFSVSFAGQAQSLLDTLQPATVMDHAAWSAQYAFTRPGVYQFYFEPEPYWEPAEDVSIIHYTKTIVAAFGEEEGWGEPLGLKSEIIPLSRPFGGYAGYVFTGQVLLDGKPVPNAEVEVEYYNKAGQFQAPSDYHVTYVVKADDQGVFNVGCPLPGWWGFAALNEGDFTIKDPDGNEKGVEIGAVLWVEMAPF